MSEYIKMWLDIIENMNNDNTYKLAWGRALLELIIEIEDVHDKILSKIPVIFLILFKCH